MFLRVAVVIIYGMSALHEIIIKIWADMWLKQLNQSMLQEGGRILLAVCGYVTLTLKCVLIR